MPALKSIFVFLLDLVPLLVRVDGAGDVGVPRVLVPVPSLSVPVVVSTIVVLLVIAHFHEAVGGLGRESHLLGVRC